MSQESFLYNHFESSQKALGDLIIDKTSIFEKLLIHQLLVIEDDSKVDNIERLYSLYTVEDKQKYDKDFIRELARSLVTTNATENNETLKLLPIYFGTTLFVDFSNISRNLWFTRTNQIVPFHNYSAFMNNAHYRLLKNPDFQQTYQHKSNSSGVAKTMFVHATVWIWSKSLSTTLQGRQEDVIINATPFVISIDTDVNANGGSFTLNLAAIEAEFRNGNWNMKEGTIKGSADNYVSQSFVHKNSSAGSVKRSDLYFENVIQENDIIWIRYETLDLEQKERKKNSSKFFIDKAELPNKVYDMIGLVDEVSVSTNGTSNDITINISGRDLTKLIIEDGVYFYPQLFANGGMFANITKDEILQRYDGQLQNLFIYSFKNVSTVLKFIMNALSNITISSENLFSSYGSSKDYDDKIVDRRSQKYLISSAEYINDENVDSFNQNTEREKNIQSVTQIQLTRNLTQDNSLEVLNRLEVFVNFLNHNDKFIFENVTDFSASQWGSVSFLGEDVKSNKLPFYFYGTLASENEISLNIDIKQLIEKIRTYIVNTTPNISSRTVTEPVKGIWQIIEIMIDESVAQRRIADSSIGNEHGSFINAIRKVCQAPFVEFFTDTYGDKFYFMVRKQPFDKKAIQSVLNGGLSIDTADGGYGPSVGSVIIDIEEHDIIKENMSYGDQAYSWYYLRPLNLLNGGQNEMNFAYLKAVYFKRYAELYGSKPLDISTNYLDFYSIKDNKLKESVAVFIKQGVLDLKYIIDINAYLPFTRRGSLTINPDRKIKRANFIRRVSTGEIFYVDSVSNSLSVADTSIDRTTSINVSRGMVEKYIKGVKVDGKTFSYFNIINTEIDESVFNQSLAADDYNKKILANWGVDDDVFNFFLKKQQFTNTQPTVSKPDTTTI